MIWSSDELSDSCARADIQERSRVGLARREEWLGPALALIARPFRRAKTSL